jgi:hypothetical protein
MRTRRIYTTALIGILLVFFAATGTHGQWSREVVLDTATGEIPIVGPKPDPRKTSFGKRVIVSVKLKRVEPRSGNNPFNTKQPVNNDDGEDFNDLTETIDNKTGRNILTDQDRLTNLGKCLGRTEMKHVAPEPANYRFGSIDIDPETLLCATSEDNLGNALIIRSPYPEGLACGVAKPGSTEWSIIDPPVNDKSGTGVELTSGQEITITVQSKTTGRKVSIKLKLIFVGAGEYAFRILEIKEVKGTG